MKVTSVLEQLQIAIRGNVMAPGDCACTSVSLPRYKDQKSCPASKRMAAFAMTISVIIVFP